MTLGHEYAGTVVAVGEDADPDLIGKVGAVYPVVPCGQCDSCQIGQYAQCSDYHNLGSSVTGYTLVPSSYTRGISDPQIPQAPTLIRISFPLGCGFSTSSKRKSLIACNRIAFMVLPSFFYSVLFCPISSIFVLGVYYKMSLTSTTLSAGIT